MLKADRRAKRGSAEYDAALIRKSMLSGSAIFWKSLCPKDGPTGEAVPKELCQSLS